MSKYHYQQIYQIFEVHGCFRYDQMDHKINTDSVTYLYNTNIVQYCYHSHFFDLQ